MEQQRMTFSARYILRVIPFEVSRLHKKNEDFLSKLFEMCSRCVFEMCFRRNRKSFFLEKVFFWFSEHFIIVSLLLFLETYTSLILWTPEDSLEFRIHSGSDFLCNIENVQEKPFHFVKGVFIKKTKKNWNSRGFFQCAVHSESDSLWSVELAQKEWRLFVKGVWNDVFCTEKHFLAFTKPSSCKFHETVKMRLWSA